MKQPKKTSSSSYRFDVLWKLVEDSSLATLLEEEFGAFGRA